MLRNELEGSIVPAKNVCEQMMAMGFDQEMVKMALKNCTNDMEKAIESLLKMQSDGSYFSAFEELLKNLPIPSDLNAGPSTSSAITTELRDTANEMKAFERFSEDIQSTDDDYLDLPLIQERSLLDEYKNLLKH